MRQKTIMVTRTGMVIALAIVIQLFGGAALAGLGPNRLFITGSLINACLLIATASGGLLAGVIISFVTPLMAGFTVHADMAAFILPFSPVIGLSNFSFVFFFWLFTKKRKGMEEALEKEPSTTTIHLKKDRFSGPMAYTGIGVGAVVKFAVLYSGVLIGLQLVSLADPFKKAITFMFSWPQLITAVLGGIVALIVIRLLRLES